MRGSSGRFGRLADSDPTAMMQFAKLTTRDARLRCHFEAVRRHELPDARINVDLALLRELASPPVSFPMTLISSRAAGINPGGRT